MRYLLIALLTLSTLSCRDITYSPKSARFEVLEEFNCSNWDDTNCTYIRDTVAEICYFRAHDPPRFTTVPYEKADPKLRKAATPVHLKPSDHHSNDQ